MSNIFGGGNANSLYTLMSEDEREVLDRLIAADDLEVHVKGWGIVNKFTAPGIRAGDARLKVPFKVHFNSPAVAIPVTFFELELRTRSGMLLYKEKQPVEYQGQALYVGAGSVLELEWDIAIRKMDPALVRAIKPGARGLTTREGNRHLDTNRKEILRQLRVAEENNKRDLARRVASAEKRSVLQYPTED